MRSSSLFGCAVVVALGAGCATVGPSSELVIARRAYAEASQPGMYPAPAPMLDAQRALNAAEYEHTYSPQSVRERHLSYIATRDAQIAMAQGSLETARLQSDASKRQYSAMLETQVSDQRMALEKATKERDDALAKLESKAAPTFKGTGVVRFNTNEARLLPETTHRLDKLAPKLSKLPAGQTVVLVGHTDATGPEAYNDELSKARADAVRDYLLSKGASKDLIVTIGKGEDQPVASNTSETGRAGNRRVDILIRQEQTACAD